MVSSSLHRLSKAFSRGIDEQRPKNYFHWLALAYNVTLARHPTVCLPVPLDEMGMPLRLQIVGPAAETPLSLVLQQPWRSPSQDPPF